MNKPLKIAGIVLGLGTVFAAGSYTGATTDWKTTAINDANASLGSAGYSKKTELVNSASTDINATVQSALNDDIVAQKAELQKMLDDYYQMKLNSMTQTQSFKDLELQIKNIQKSIYDRYVKEIDTAFAAQQ